MKLFPWNFLFCNMQAGISLLMAAILVIWTAATFRRPLPRPLPDNLGVNYSGLSSIAVMPISLFSASIFRYCVVWMSQCPAASSLVIKIAAADSLEWLAFGNIPAPPAHIFRMPIDDTIDVIACANVLSCRG